MYRYIRKRLYSDISTTSTIRLCTFERAFWLAGLYKMGPTSNQRWLEVGPVKIILANQRYSQPWSRKYAHPQYK
jgi:hypothetical protein